jgi:signal transduction histidine kinase/CheY-like chemotaxis protein/HPt (histidine-containing phosphotransfer) domain-containing protein
MNFLPIRNFFKLLLKKSSRNIVVSAAVILILFTGIGINYFIESRVFDSVKYHTSKTDLVVKYEKYKQVIDKTNFEIAQLDSKLSNYLLSGNAEQLNAYQLQLDKVEAEFSSIAGDASLYAPKYLVNIFLHKAKNKIWYKNQVLQAYEEYGKAYALKMMNGAEYAKISNEYAQGDAELVKSLNTTIAGLNQSLLKSKSALLNLDDKWNFISLVFMLLIGCLVVYQMIETKRLNNRLFQSVQKEKQAQAIKDQFMSNMTHELRTPLNSIVGYTNLLLKRNHTTETKNWVQAIHTSGKMLMEVINDVLDYSKIESGYIHFVNEPFNLDTVLYDLKNIMSNRADSKKISLSVLKDNSLPSNLTGDEKKLMQILINLVGNAIKFTEKGGVKIEVALKKNLGDKLLLEFIVSDTGIGISEKNLPYVFDRFYQIESGYTKKYSGTGLGLPIVKQLIDMQGGSIIAKSSPDAGTVFSFVLPFEEYTGQLKEETELNLAPVKSIISKQQKKILVVDDHELNRELLVSLLKEHNYSAETAANGLQAIEKLTVTKFDVVLMDIQMPELDGIETTKRIRSQLQTNMPVIAFTAFNQPAEKQACLQAGMDGYLAKPVNEPELMQMLHFYLYEQSDVDQPKETLSGLINYDQIQTIVGSNREFANHILAKAIAQIPEEMDELYKAILAKNKNETTEVAHHLRSTLGLIGAGKSILEKASNIEYADVNDARKQAEALVWYHELNQMLGTVLTELRQYIAA